MIRKRFTSISQRHIVPGFSSNGKKVVNSCMGLWYPERGLAINVPINRMCNGVRTHCPVITALSQEGAEQEATIIEADSPGHETFAYGFTLCASCVLRSLCPNCNNFLELEPLVKE